jgi:hypothetical protein
MRACRFWPRYFLAFWLGLARGGPKMSTPKAGPLSCTISPCTTPKAGSSPRPSVVGDDGKPQEPKANPYSPAQTCGKCHDYDAISEGWHFNADSAAVPPGRPGEPWILTDPATRTQIPLSYRGWAGTFKPSDLGLSDFEFVTNFARHFPGGGPGEPDKIKSTDPQMGRMNITGKLEIDCLICHQNTGRYDHEARFNALQSAELPLGADHRRRPGRLRQFQERRQHRRFLASRPARSLRFCPPSNMTAPASTPRTTSCSRSRAAHLSIIVIIVTPANPPLGDARWHSDLDVHIKAGLLCVDCHRNGLDHAIVRGYEGEARDRVISDSMVNLRTAADPPRQRRHQRGGRPETGPATTPIRSGPDRNPHLPRLSHRGTAGFAPPGA